MIYFMFIFNLFTLQYLTRGCSSEAKLDSPFKFGFHFLGFNFVDKNENDGENEKEPGKIH